jgi:hypothetical protein
MLIVVHSPDRVAASDREEDMTNLLSKSLPLLDTIVAPFVYPSALLMKGVRRAGVQRLPHCRSALLKMGVFPILDHYYEPKFDNRNPKIAFSQDRTLPGIDWNVEEQLELLTQFTAAQELVGAAPAKSETLEFNIDNRSFGPGDADYWYQLIRWTRPKRIFEVGSGNSTLMAIKASRKNRALDPSYTCKHVCIEPYEMPWLEKTGLTIVRKKVEDLDVEFFSELECNDILFIDSSHVIRPEGDVLFEYLQLLPTLKRGVIVHIHDIFSPKNYLTQWMEKDIRFWNEQYLLEAFLSNNSSWKVIGALNFLRHHHYDAFKRVAPFLSPDNEPGSFYIQKTA